MRAWLVILALVPVTACGGASTSKPAANASPKTVTVTGTLALQPGDTPYSNPNYTGGSDPGRSCAGTGGYSDIAGAASVTVRDPSGKVIGVGSLDDGAINRAGDACEFSFAVFDVPAQKFYGIEVSHRGTVNFTAEDVAARSVLLTLGG